MDQHDMEPAPADEAQVQQQVQTLHEAYRRIREQMGRVIAGQTEVIEEILVCLLCRGHCLLEGMPGLAKTSIIRTLARMLDLSFRRIQFTPDLMPTDITGTDVVEEDPATGRRAFRFIRGPLFANVVLADEINRTPPKTQAALLESMQEMRVTAGGTTHELEAPFFVMATQNPIEQEGTYPLPEAQLDRFMFKILVDYPDRADEIRIAEAIRLPELEACSARINGRDLLALQTMIEQVLVSRPVIAYAVDLVRATRPGADDAPDFIRQWVMWGASPRASRFLLLAARARAILNGRLHVCHDDVRGVARPVLRHRIGAGFAAESEGVTVEEIITRLLDAIPEPAPDRRTDAD